VTTSQPCSSSSNYNIHDLGRNDHWVRGAYCTTKLGRSKGVGSVILCYMLRGLELFV
jgi:hypothetical protein